MDQFNFSNFPFSNFNEVNLDWFFEQFNDFMEKVNSGYFKGPPGDNYILTSADKQEIASIVLAELPTWQGGSY